MQSQSDVVLHALGWLPLLATIVALGNAASVEPTHVRVIGAAAIVFVAMKAA